MKLTQPDTTSGNFETVIARFGEAALIQRPEGIHILAGGSRNDRSEAKEWISLFMHEIVIRDN